MSESSASRAAAVLGVLADLGPVPPALETALVIPLDWFHWLPLDATGLFAPSPLPETAMDSSALEPPTAMIDRDLAERLAGIAQIRVDNGLRAGWLFLAGRTTDASGRRRRVFQPLVTVPVIVQRSRFPSGPLLAVGGDPQLTPLVADLAVRRALEARLEVGGGALAGLTTTEIDIRNLARLTRLSSFAFETARAAGFPVERLIGARADPEELMRAEPPVVVVGCGVYSTKQEVGVGRAVAVREWLVPTIEVTTAFHSMYLGVAHDRALAMPAERVESPFVLTPAQREAVVRSRSAPITVISGAPGTGKSHTIAAIVCDALGRGETVLVAAKADATVDALVDLLERAPGPNPMIFGSNERRRQLAARLASGQFRGETEFVVNSRRTELAESIRRRDEMEATIIRMLRGEQSSGRPDDEIAVARAAAPELFNSDLDLAAVRVLIDRLVTAPPGGWFARRRRRIAQRQLAGLVGRAIDAERVVALRSSLEVAEGLREAAALASAGGLVVGGRWQELLAAENTVCNDSARWLAAETRSERRLNASSLSALAAMATALRSGRAARREQLLRLKDDALTMALPLWIGTLDDVDDLLPHITALFDLVVLDEASSIDQPLACTTLLRGRRGVVVGDPRQLRHVSFVSDERVRDAIGRSGLADDTALVSRLDVRRNSAFDVAAGSAPVIHLDEHFRGDPHLIEFVATRLYDGRLHVATRSPLTDSKDCIEMRLVDGHRDREGVITAEVTAVIAEVRRLLGFGQRSVGVVTPFRAQADALETAVLAAFTTDELLSLDLRVGTVHEFQGIERDTIVGSLGIGPAAPPGTWTFAQDRHLLAVFLTRARRKIIIVRSADPPPGGILAAYLRQVDEPPGPPKSGSPKSGLVESAWVASVAQGLADAGLSPRSAYPAGRHLVDIAVGGGAAAYAIDCHVHPDGPTAHIDRNLSLLRAGWRIADAFESRWGERPAELAVELAAIIRR